MGLEYEQLQGPSNEDSMDLTPFQMFSPSDCVLAGIPRDPDSSGVSSHSPCSSSPRECALQIHSKSDKLSVSFASQKPWALGVGHNINSDSQKLKNDEKDSLKDGHLSFKKWLISEETLSSSQKLNGSSKGNMTRSRNGNRNRSRSRSLSPSPRPLMEKSLETDNSKAQGPSLPGGVMWKAETVMSDPLGKVSPIMIPDSQKLLRIDLDSLKSQLQAQTKAFEFLNHSVTLLEKESSHQRVKIQELEEVMSLSCCPAQDDLIRRGAELGRQELWRALARGLQEVKENLRGSEEAQRGRTTRSLLQLGQEIRESKKFLWEELEMLQEEVTYIHQKLKAQEEEITKNLVNIKKMQKNQVKCRKVLTKMKQQGGMIPEEITKFKDWWGQEELEEELNDIWSAVNTLQNAIESLSLTGVKHRGILKNRRAQRCASPPPPPAWATDSDSDVNPPHSP
ncbi:coiled-coil domain-containing protein 159 isoform X2 [Dromiciops gliroides]|uniref:coiled-coil domain-containing protein 159 isoform X2 n=1 Tax=Dromiciops gliroides TaxID=33562 RepID=UPI001CC38F42|nr:coiled-coil domain-containing protein 159 isoform X2 [Dromiciops gliroides]